MHKHLKCCVEQITAHTLNRPSHQRLNLKNTNDIYPLLADFKTFVVYSSKTNSYKSYNVRALECKLQINNHKAARSRNY